MILLSNFLNNFELYKEFSFNNVNLGSMFYAPKYPFFSFNYKGKMILELYNNFQKVNFTDSYYNNSMYDSLKGKRIIYYLLVEYLDKDFNYQRVKLSIEDIHFYKTCAMEESSLMSDISRYLNGTFDAISIICNSSINSIHVSILPNEIDIPFLTYKDTLLSLNITSYDVINDISDDDCNLYINSLGHFKIKYDEDIENLIDIKNNNKLLRLKDMNYLYIPNNLENILMHCYRQYIFTGTNRFVDIIPLSDDDDVCIKIKFKKFCLNGVYFDINEEKKEGIFKASKLLFIGYEVLHDSTINNLFRAGRDFNISSLFRLLGCTMEELLYGSIE